MRICHISDIHWRGLARHDEYTESFERLFHLLKTEIKPDLIINTGDTYHTKTHGITPEVIEKLSWMIRNLADIAPTIHILGNHDGNLLNLSRQDAITPIHDAIRHQNSFLLKQSGTYNFCDLNNVTETLFHGSDVYLHVFSPFDKDKWKDLKPVENKINIALFHGAVNGSIFDSNVRLLEADIDVSFFSGYDFVLLGDIHKHQIIAKRCDYLGIEKPWIAYPGSLIQQNFGESIEKGFLVWDIYSKNSWNCEFVKLENRSPFLTVNWSGSVGKTIKEICANFSKNIIPPGTRIRITSPNPIHQIETKQLINELKLHHGVSEVCFKYCSTGSLDLIDAAGKKISKTDLRHDIDTIIKLYFEFMQTQHSNIVLTESQKVIAKDIIKKYLDRFNFEEMDIQSSRNNTWSIKSLKFDNIFCYGANNVVNFENMNGIVGIFGPNKTGKSSIIGALMYALYNTTDRGPIKAAHIINKNKNACRAEVKFSVGNNEYLVVRETTRNIPKKNPKKEDYEKTVTTLHLYKILPNGSYQELNSVSKDDTDKEIRKLIGNAQDFLMTAFSNQGGASRFIDEGATQRKAILNRFLGLDLFEKLFLYAKEDFSILNEKTRKYVQTDWNEEIARIDKEIMALEKQNHDLQEKLSNISAQKDELRLWLLQHNKINLNILNNLNELKVSARKKEEEILNLTNLITKFKNDISKLETEKLKLLKEYKKYDIDDLRKKMELLETKKAKLLEAKHQYTLQNKILEQQTRSIKKLSVVPCGDMFPTCQFIKDSHEDKKKINEQTQLVQEMMCVINDLENTIRELTAANVASTIKYIDEIKTKEKEITHNIEILNNNLLSNSRILEITKNSLIEIENKILDIESSISVAETEQVEKQRMLYESLEENYKNIQKQSQNILMQLGGKIAYRQKLLNEKSEYEKDLEYLNIQNTIQMAFSKNGIPAIILKTQLPIINAELAKILDGFVDFRVTLETDINSNVMDVYIEDEHSRRLIELASGMEKMISSIALRVAFVNSLSVLPRSDIFIVDEGWGALDAENLQKVSSFLSELNSYFKSIIIISHIQEIKEVAMRVIEIQTKDNESYVKYIN